MDAQIESRSPKKKCKRSLLTVFVACANHSSSANTPHVHAGVYIVKQPVKARLEDAAVQGAPVDIIICISTGIYFLHTRLSGAWPYLYLVDT